MLFEFYFSDVFQWLITHHSRIRQNWTVQQWKQTSDTPWRAWWEWVWLRRFMPFLCRAHPRSSRWSLLYDMQSSSVRPFVRPLPVLPSVNQFVHLCIHGSFVRPSVRWLFRSIVRSFIPLFFRSYSFIHAFSSWVFYNGFTKVGAFGSKTSLQFTFYYSLTQSMRHKWDLFECLTGVCSVTHLQRRLMRSNYKLKMNYFGRYTCCILICFVVCLGAVVCLLCQQSPGN